LHGTANELVGGFRENLWDQKRLFPEYFPRPSSLNIQFSSSKITSQLFHRFQITTPMRFSTFLLSILLAAVTALPLDAVPGNPKEVNPVEVGSTAPNISLVRADGTPVQLHDLVAEHPGVFVFYRGGWCPYCNDHLSELGEVADELAELGYRIHALSADRPEKVSESAASGGVTYSLYSDASADAARAFGLAFAVDDGTYQKLLDYGIDLEDASGKEHHLLPVPAVFLIDRDGNLRKQKFGRDEDMLLGAEIMSLLRESAPLASAASETSGGDGCTEDGCPLPTG